MEKEIVKSVRQPAGEACDRARLQELEIMLTGAQRLARVGSWIWEAATDRLTWSEETFRILKVGQDDFDGTLEGFIGIVHPDDQRALREAAQGALAGSPLFTYRYRVRGRDGRERLITGDGEAQRDESGRVRRLIGTILDITERERERQALRESEERLRSLVALTSDWYWEQDAELRFTRLTGGPGLPAGRDSLVVGKRRWEIPGIEPIGWTWEEHRAALAACQPFRDLDLHIVDGCREYYVSIAGEPSFGDDGAFLGYHGTARDITARVRAEQQVGEVNASLTMAMRLGRIGVWSLEAADRRLQWWGGGRFIHTLEGGIAASMDDLLGRAEPAARPKLREALERCMREGARFDMEVPLSAGVQPFMWARLIGEPLRDLRGLIRQVRGTVQDVTERRLAAEQARELSARLADTLDGVSDCFLTVDPRWAITYVNTQAERLLQRSRDELVGQDLWRCFPQLLGTPFEQAYRRAATENVTIDFEEFFEPSWAWLQVRVYASPQGLAICFRDATDNHKVQEALASSREQLRQLFENSMDAVLYTDAEGHVTRANPAACTILGRSAGRIHDCTFSDFLAADEAGLPALWEQRAMTGRASGQLLLKRGDGTVFPAELSSAEYTSRDETTHAFVVFRDISQRVEAQRQVLQLNAELGERVRQRTAELEVANQELKAVAHALAHDLRGPAAAVEAFSELLEGSVSDALAERPAHYLRRIRAGARKITEYTEGLLSLARISQVPLLVQQVDLSAIARDVLTQLAEREPHRDVAWRVQDGLVALGDANLLRIVLDNLLGNAWKFTSRTPAARIAFCADVHGGAVTYHVKDNGAGFDPAYAHKLFTNFGRLHGQDEFPGTGIGLTSVHRIVTRHGGGISAEGREGAGACFSFTLRSVSVDEGWADRAD
jgi:PAS domain S-box-containing protein